MVHRQQGSAAAAIAPPASPLLVAFVQRCDRAAGLLGLTRRQVSGFLFDSVDEGETGENLDDGNLDRLLTSHGHKHSLSDFERWDEALDELLLERGFDPESVASRPATRLSLVPTVELSGLPALVERAASRLALASSAAEVLEARDEARVAYDAAKSAGRMARAKQAHDDIIAAVYRAQADALEIEAGAKRRLADEFDAAQDRGEVQRPGGNRTSIVPDQNIAPTVAELGLSRKDVHEARQIRDAEVAEPGIVKRTIEERIETGQEPTKAALREAIAEAAMSGLRGAGAKSRRNALHEPNLAYDAMSNLTGYCRDIVESYETYGAKFILSGFLDEPMMDRGMASFRQARDILTEIMEAGHGR